MPTQDDVAQYRANWQDEIDSAALYQVLAEIEQQPQLAEVYRRLAAVEEKHAQFWEKRLRAAGVEAPPRRPSWRSRVLAWLARRHFHGPFRDKFGIFLERKWHFWTHSGIGVDQELVEKKWSDYDIQQRPGALRHSLPGAFGAHLCFHVPVGALPDPAG